MITVLNTYTVRMQGLQFLVHDDLSRQLVEVLMRTIADWVVHNCDSLPIGVALVEDEPAFYVTFDNPEDADILAKQAVAIENEIHGGLNG